MGRLRKASERKAPPLFVYGWKVLVFEDPPQLFRRHLTALRVRSTLHGLAEFDLEPARQIQLVPGLHQVGHAPLARLTVHTDDRFVGAPYVLGIDREVRHRPGLLGDGRPSGRSISFEVFEALLDRILVRP